MTESTTAAHFQGPGSQSMTRNDTRVTFTPTGDSARLVRVACVTLQSSPQPRKRRWWNRGR